MKLLKNISTSILFLLTTWSCSKSGEKPDVAPIDSLADRYKLWIQDKQDSSGFILSDKCDSVLFSGLIGSVQGVSVDLTDAMDDNGKWYRRPAKDCYATGGSKSETSRDMLLGVLYYSWYNKDLTTLEKTWEYAEANDWILGKGPEGRTKVEFWMRGTLAQMIHVMGGKSHIERFYPTPSSLGAADGFNRHLETLHLLLRGEAYGKLGSLAKLTLRNHYNAQPQNPLYSFAHARWNDEDYGRVVSRLSEMYPMDRLPNKQDWKSPWVIERDFGADWMPDPSGSVDEHTGGTFLLVYHLLKKV